jgi:hypothetical protein
LPSNKMHEPSRLMHLRAYRHWHPDARVHLVEHRGRTVWMSGKQYNIWSYFQSYHRRGKRTTLRQIAEACSCSRATVSRFLRRLDLWRFIDLATVVGLRGGTWVLSRRAPDTSRDAELWRAGARITMASRKRARDRMAARIREWETAFRMRQIWRPEMRGYPGAQAVVRVQHLTPRQFGIWGE